MTGAAIRSATSPGSTSCAIGSTSIAAAPASPSRSAHGHGAIGGAEIDADAEARALGSLRFGLRHYATSTSAGATTLRVESAAKRRQLDARRAPAAMQQRASKRRLTRHVADEVEPRLRSPAQSSIASPSRPSRIGSSVT